MSLDEEWEQSGLVGKMAAGRYLIVSELATDGRRTLYEAENVELGTRVTLGVVRADGTPTEARLQNGQKLRSLKQPGLVGVLDVGKLDSGDLYVATERPDGTTLRTLAAGKRLEPRRALLIIRQVLEALAAAHAVGALHGDVKPDHILIMPGLGDDRVKLTDFGVAALTGAMRAGDPVYSAPESAFGAIDGRADIYSTGAVLFELLTGHPPFFADEPDALRRMHAYAPMQTLKQRVPDLAFADLLETVVATALEKKRDARYQSASDMIAALDGALEVIEDAVAQPPPSATSERRRKPNDSLLLLAKDLIPAQAADPSAKEPLVPDNVTRQVPELPWPTRARQGARRGFKRARAVAARLVHSIRALDRRLGVSVWLRRAFGTAVDKLGLRVQLERLTYKQRRALGAGAAALGFLLVVAIATRGDDKPTPRTTASAEDAKAYLERGRTALADGDEQDALTAYEKAIRLAPASASERHVIDDVSRLASSKDADVRHRAFVLADHNGFGAKVDRVAGWILDLEQATTCDERRAAIRDLGASADRRALPVLRKAKAHKCVERDATAAIQRVSKASKPR